MYWEETHNDLPAGVPADIVDVVFTISCRSLPVDHAYALSQAVLGVLPWLAEELGAGVHPIHVAESGNGWMRPENAADLLHLSRRTRLALRMNAQRIPQASALVGRTLDVAGYPLEVKAQTSVRHLSDITTIFSRYVVADTAADETRFLKDVLAELAQMDIHPKKMLPGRMKVIMTPDEPVATRSLMLADLTPQESVTLQRRGLGPYRHMGCGLFLPHKDITPAGQSLR